MGKNLEEKYVKGLIKVDGIDVKTFKTEFDSCNIIEVEAGSTGYKGGDTGHGGRTYFRIKDLASTDMRCAVRNNGQLHEFDNVGQIELIFGGDCEMETFYEALCFGADVLGEHTSGMSCYEPQISHKEIQQTNFALYINELCDQYRKTHSLKGKSKLREKYRVSDISIQDFFECELNKAEGYVSQDFCNKVYDYVLDTTKAIAAPKYNE